MSKLSTKFVCQSCGASYPRWSGKCEQCNSWNSLLEEAVSQGGSYGKTQAAMPLVATKLKAVQALKLPRLTSGILEFDQVLGGGIVAGSVMLLSGDPGIGKSTLVLQLASHLAKSCNVLYVSGEESATQIKLRADRLSLGESNLDLLTETSVDTVVATIDQGKYDLVVIDSIQTMAVDILTGSPGTVGQITASAQVFQSLAKRNNVAMLIIGHVTKEGNIAGPKILEHLVDVVLYLEGDRYGAFKALRGIKNRFGSTSEVGIFEMNELGMVPVPNPSAALLAERQPGAGSVVLATVEGTRPLLVEVQALVASTNFGYPKRTAVGFDLNRLNLLVAVMAKRASLDLSNSDVYVNIVGGLKITEPAADLAIILSIASAFRNIATSPQFVTFGEVGLSGEIRSVPQVAKRLAEASKLGLIKAIGPTFGKHSNMTGVANVAEAVKVSLDSKIK